MRSSVFLVGIWSATAFAQASSDPTTPPSSSSPAPRSAPASPPAGPSNDADEPGLSQPVGDPTLAPDGYQRMQTLPSTHPPPGSVPTSRDDGVVTDETGLGTELHRGFTFELGAGFGLTQRTDDRTFEPYPDVAGLSVGIGGWLHPRLALTMRFSVLKGSPERHSFLGPALQVWFADQFWIGGGAGAGFYTMYSSPSDRSEAAMALEGRLGFSFKRGTRSTITMSFEATTANFDKTFHDRVVTLALLLGFQYL